MSETMTPAILYVDDETTALKYFQRALASLAPVLTADSVEAGRQLLDEHAGRITVLVSDQRMPGAYGYELLAYARERYPSIVRVLTTAYSELEHTVEAVNQGQIHRYIQKPWDIAALRLELSQALDLARLRSEHAQLLREKLAVRQKQVIAARIGMVYTLSAGIAGEVSTMAVESYLAAAQLAGVTAPEPDWLLIDHSDLTSAEAFRNAAFALSVREHLEEIDSRYSGAQPHRILAMLEENFGVACSVLGTTGVLFHDAADLAEFLASPSGDVISSPHAFWLAALLWLGRHGWLLQVAAGEGGGVQARLEQGAPMLSPGQLAAWVERF